MDRSRTAGWESAASLTLDEENSVHRDRRRLIIGDLLRDFSMSETQRRFRCSSPVVYTLDDCDLSYSSAIAAREIRLRLRHLTGSDKIRINDPNYIHLLASKLQDEYEEQLQRREKELMENEKQRVRRLIVLGLITEQEAAEGDRSRVSKRAATPALSPQLARSGSSHLPPLVPAKGAKHSVSSRATTTSSRATTTSSHTCSDAGSGQLAAAGRRNWSTGTSTDRLPAAAWERREPSVPSRSTERHVRSSRAKADRDI